MVDGFVSRAREIFDDPHRAMLDSAVEYMVAHGCEMTYEGNWRFGFDELPGISAQDAEKYQSEIENMLAGRVEIADVEIIDGTFDAVYYLQWCPNAWREEDEPAKTEAPARSVLAKLKESQKAVATADNVKKDTPKQQKSMEDTR